MELRRTWPSGNRSMLAVLVALALLGPAARLAWSANPGCPELDRGAPVNIFRTAEGTPGIVARGGSRPLFFANGYVHAEDRLWQMEFLRRAAKGESAAIFGVDFLEQDVMSRTLFGPVERRTALFDDASARVQAALEAYADGVNAFIDQAICDETLPPEFAAFGFELAPWTVEDSIAIQMLLGFQVGANGLAELNNAKALAGLIGIHGPEKGAAIFADTHWVDDRSSPTTVSRGGVLPLTSGGTGVLPLVAADFADAARDASEVIDGFTESMDGMGLAGPHSNAIVIHGSLTKTGFPLLLAGPQVGNTSPQFFHEISLHGAGYSVSGVGVPGVPGVVIGVHGTRDAWTLTSGLSDNLDVFAEALNPENPAQYLFDGEFVDLDCRLETIDIAGASPITVTVCGTHHGPVIGSAGGLAFSLAAPFFGHELDFLEGGLDLMRANTLRRMHSAAKRIPYNFNILAVSGNNIAYWHTGRIPIRAEGANPLFPQSGIGDSEWQGMIPFADMPQAVNPEQGYLVNWNNKPAPGWVNFAGGFASWGPVFRVQKLIELLDEIKPKSATLDTLAEINRIAGQTSTTPKGRDTIMVTGLLDALVAEVDEAADERLAAILDILITWDHQAVDESDDGTYDNPGVAIFNAWIASLLGAFDEVGDSVNIFVMQNLILRQIQGTDAALPLLVDYLEGSSVDEWVTGSLIAAADNLTDAFGSADESTWLEPVLMRTWTPIGAAVVADTVYKNRGTYNHLIQTGPGAKFEAISVLAPGVSGNPFSPHVSDQLELYDNWEYKTMVVRKSDVIHDFDTLTKIRVPAHD